MPNCSQMLGVISLKSKLMGMAMAGKIRPIRLSEFVQYGNNQVCSQGQSDMFEFKFGYENPGASCPNF